MGVIAKQGVINLITSYAGVIIGAVNTILLFPNIFTAAEFGLTRVIVSAAMMSSSLFSFGVSSFAIKFFPFFKDKSTQNNGFLFFIMLVPFIGYLIFLIVSFFFKPSIINYYSTNSSLFSEYYGYTIILTFYIIYLNVFDSYLKALHKSVFYNFLDNIVLKCFWLILIILYYFKVINFNEFIFGYVNTYGLLILFELLYLMYIKEFFILPNFKKFDLKTIKEILFFGVLTMFGSGITGMAATIDSLVIGSIDKTGLEGVAFYSVAFYVSFLIVIPFNALTRIINTSISEAWKNNDLVKINDFYKKSSNNLLLIGMFIFLVIWLNVDSLFELLPTEYTQAKYVLLFICLAKLFEISVGINGIIINFSKYYKLIFYINILLILLLIVTDYLLIPIMGIVGAALATLISTLIVLSIYLIVLYKNYKLLPFTNKSFLILIISIIIYFIVNLIPDFNHIILNVGTRSFIILILFFPSVYVLNISLEFNKLIVSTFQYLGITKKH